MDDYEGVRSRYKWNPATDEVAGSKASKVDFCVMNAIFDTAHTADQGEHPLDEKPTILLAEDDPAIRQILYRLLADEGYNVVTAGNGVEALEIALMAKIDLLLIDLNMPGKDGWEVFEQLSVNYPSLPVILITDPSNQFFNALAAGAGALMENPLDFTQLFVNIHNLLEEPVAVRLARALGQTAALNHIPDHPEPTPIWAH